MFECISDCCSPLLYTKEDVIPGMEVGEVKYEDWRGFPVRVCSATNDEHC